MEPVQVRLRLARVVRALVDNVRRAFRLEVRVVAETDLADGTVFPKDFVEVGTGEVEVAKGVGVSEERGGWGGLRVDKEIDARGGNTIGGRERARYRDGRGPGVLGWKRTGGIGMG
jgi:hypothetical protein